MEITKTIDFELVARLNQSVHDLHSRLYPEYFKEYNYERIKDFFEKIIDRPEYIFLLLNNSKQSIGYAWLEIRTYQENPFMNSYRSIFIHQISVNESNRNNGFGTELMKKIYEISKDNKINRIELDYWMKNEIAARFYNKRGFKGYRKFVYKEIF